MPLDLPIAPAASQHQRRKRGKRGRAHEPANEPPLWDPAHWTPDLIGALVLTAVYTDPDASPSPQLREAALRELNELENYRYRFADGSAARFFLSRLMMCVETYGALIIEAHRERDEKIAQANQRYMDAYLGVARSQVLTAATRAFMRLALVGGISGFAVALGLDLFASEEVEDKTTNLPYLTGLCASAAMWLMGEMWKNLRATNLTYQRDRTIQKARVVFARKRQAIMLAAKEMAKLAHKDFAPGVPIPQNAPTSVLLEALLQEDTDNMPAPPLTRILLTSLQRQGAAASERLRAVQRAVAARFPGRASAATSADDTPDAMALSRDPVSSDPRG